MDVILSNLRELVMDREAWCAAVDAADSQRVRHDWVAKLRAMVEGPERKWLENRRERNPGYRYIDTVMEVSTNVSNVLSHDSIQ